MSSHADWGTDVWVAVSAAALAAAVLLVGGITMAVRRSRRESMQPSDMRDVPWHEQRPDMKRRRVSPCVQSASLEPDASLDMPLLTLKNGVKR